jgi:hypothetical protein
VRKIYDGALMPSSLGHNFNIMKKIKIPTKEEILKHAEWMKNNPRPQKQYVCIKEWTHWGGKKYKVGDKIPEMIYTVTEHKECFEECKTN